MFSDDTSSSSDLSTESNYLPEVPFSMMHGPFDGTFCVPESEFLITLWNPAAREHRALPQCRAGPLHCTKAGFGLDSSTNDDYKFIHWSWLMNKVKRLVISHIWWFTSTTWLQIVGEIWPMAWNILNYDVIHITTTLYLNGVCNWLAKQRLIEHMVIISFDMSNEALFEQMYVTL